MNKTLRPMVLRLRYRSVREDMEENTKLSGRQSTTKSRKWYTPRLIYQRFYLIDASFQETASRYRSKMHIVDTFRPRRDMLVH